MKIIPSIISIIIIFYFFSCSKQTLAINKDKKICPIRVYKTSFVNGNNIQKKIFWSRIYSKFGHVKYEICLSKVEYDTLLSIIKNKYKTNEEMKEFLGVGLLEDDFFFHNVAIVSNFNKDTIYMNNDYTLIKKNGNLLANYNDSLVSKKMEVLLRKPWGATNCYD